MKAQFGTNIECPRRGCRGKLDAVQQCIDPLTYGYFCKTCNHSGMWDHLVQLKKKIASPYYGSKHSFPKTQADEFNLAIKRKKNLDYSEEYDTLD